MKLEFSAGGVVVKKEEGETYILLTQHSGHHGWGFPKGLIDKGEDKKTTALREVSEEGGVQAKIIDDLTLSEYFYKFEGDTIKKKVNYFLMEYLSGDPVDHDWEMEDARWIPLEKVGEKLSFANDKKVFQEAKKKIKK